MYNFCILFHLSQNFDIMKTDLLVISLKGKMMLSAWNYLFLFAYLMFPLWTFHFM